VPNAGNVDRRNLPYTLSMPNVGYASIRTFGSAWVESTDIRRASIRLFLALAVHSGLFEWP
jgi:hypothetical protein